MGNIIFEPFKFIENLQYMGVGIMGVFLIIGIIIGATYAVNFFCNNTSK